jgi:hypothetical protein
MTSSPILQRPTTIAEMQERGKRFNSEESRRRGLEFQPLPTDVFISPYPKSGTTWLQQIVHGLRTRGDMNFGEITEVVPWLEMAYDLGLDLDAPQPTPRAFKSHLTWHDIPKGGRYIISVRHPRDVLLSYYLFFEGWWFVPGSISVATLANEHFLAHRGYWHHLASWWEQRSDPNVLILCYEEMRQNLPQTVQTVARFIDCELDPALLDTVVRHSSLEFMLAHEDQFDDHLVRQTRDAVCGLPPGGDSSKVKEQGIASPRPVVPQEICEKIDAIWQEEMDAKFGLPTYQSLRDEIVRLNKAG